MKFCFNFNGLASGLAANTGKDLLHKLARRELFQPQLQPASFDFAYIKQVVDDLKQVLRIAVNVGYKALLFGVQGAV